MDPRAPAPGGSAARAVAARTGLSLPSLGRTLGVLYVCGGLVALLWLALPHGASRGDGTVLTMALLAVVLGAALAACAHRLVTTSLHLVLAAIQVVVGVGCVATARPDTDLRLFFLWAAPYAALYFGRRAAAAHLAWTSLVATVAVVAVPGPVPRPAAAGLLLLVSTLCAAGVLVAVAARALRRAEAVQRQQASLDALTGLGNRRTLLEVLHAPPETACAGTSALVLLDLDGFKAVNDRYGHACGDEVLREVAARLTGVVRADDVVCRLGGDEFAVVVRGLRDEADAWSFATRVSDAVDLLVGAGGPGSDRTDRTDRTDRPLAVRASAGVRLLGPDGPDPTTALRHADVALYASKTAGRATVELWREGMRRAGEELDELSDDLRQALREDQLRLVYQPVVDARTLQVRGVEALARWRHPVRGDVPPEVFVACAERSGLAGT
jgi:diguanylate cyclase (GGDEF)-like protein